MLNLSVERGAVAQVTGYHPPLSRWRHVTQTGDLRKALAQAGRLVGTARSRSLVD